MKLRPHQWLGAFALALGAHVAVLAAINVPVETTRQPVEQGVEIDLGLALPVPPPAPPESQQPLVEPEPRTELPELEPTADTTAAVAPLKPKEEKRKKPKAKPIKTPPPVKPVEPTPEPPLDAPEQSAETTSKLPSEATASGPSKQTAEDAVPNHVSTGNPAARNNYYAQLAAWLGKHKRYPHAAKRRRAEGTVTVEFVIDRTGALVSSRIQSSSGHRLLDQAALDMIERAAPMPDIPSELNQDRLTITLPIEFSLRN